MELPTAIGPHYLIGLLLTSLQPRGWYYLLQSPKRPNPLSRIDSSNCVGVGFIDILEDHSKRPVSHRTQIKAEINWTDSIVHGVVRPKQRNESSGRQSFSFLPLLSIFGRWCNLSPRTDGHKLRNKNSFASFLALAVFPNEIACMANEELKAARGPE